MAERHTVVFFAIDEPLKPGAATRGKIEAIAVAFDPRRATLAEVQKALERKLGPSGLSLLAMRVMDRPGDLAQIRRAR